MTYFGHAFPPYSQISRLVCQIKRENVINNPIERAKTVVSFVFWECIQQPKLLLWLQKRFPNQRGYVTIMLPGSQRTSYFNFVPPLPSRVFRILKSTRRDKPLLYSCRAANLLQETYLGCITIWKANFFWQAISKKQKFPRRTYLLPSSLLVVAKSTANFFSSWANYSCFF